VADLAIGLDLGGTNLRAAGFRGLAAAVRDPGATAAAVRPLAEERVPVGEPRDPEAIVERIAAIVDRLVAATGGDAATPVGVGFAGMLRGDDGLVANSPHLRWRDVRFGALLRARLAGRRVVVENDVNAIAWGEARLGAARGARDVLAVYVGTGIGAGIVSAGQLVRGATGCAAELGHTKLDWGADAPPCACGKAGCVETFVGGTYLLRRAHAALGGGARSRAVELAGAVEAVHPGHIDAAAAEGDPWALALWDEVAPRLGVTLANAVTLLEPEVLILGGGVLSRTPLLRELALAAFEIAVNAPARADLRIADAALGDDAGLVGSALLALDAPRG
jgi:glucokinase